MTDVHTASTLRDNLAVIRQRWPELTSVIEQAPDLSASIQLVQGMQPTIALDGIQLTSRHDRIADAAVQADKVPTSARQATLFGTGLGDIQNHLLRRNALQRLTVVILNPGLFRFVLANSEQTSWLADPRVTLVYDPNRRLQAPLTCQPAEVFLAGPACEGLRDRLLWWMNESKINRVHSASNPSVQQRFRALLPLIRNDIDVATLFHRAGCNGPSRAMVVATGPSLQFAYQRLASTRHNAVVIAVDTALKPLLDAGIVPDYVVTVDANITAEHLQVDRVPPIPLVYFPCAERAVLERWPGTRIAAVWESRSYDKLASQAKCGRLFNSGSVTHSAVDLAVKMGVTEVELIGCDFAYPNGQTHTGYADGELGASAKHTRYRVTASNGEPVATEPNMAMYLRSLEDYIRRHPQVGFINVSTIGAKIAGTVTAGEWAA